MTMAMLAAVAMIVLVLLVWLLFAPQSVQTRDAGPLEIKQLLPVHCRHFPQIKRILNGEDEAFVARRASRKNVKLWRRERKQILQLYLQGLAQDFQNLTELARLISKLSPEIRPSQELELLKLTVQFQTLYRLTMLRIGLRFLPLPELWRLTEIVAGLGFELELLLDQMTALIPQAGLGSTA